jgi:hypothetical protein
MIRINKGETNTVTVTLFENSTVANPIYLFQFVNQQSQVSYYFIATDTSAYLTRYNRFEVTETTNPDTLDGEVELEHEGFYDYYVFQTDLENTTGLTNASEAVENIVKQVETGLVWVVPAEQVTHTYTPQASQTIIYE